MKKVNQRKRALSFLLVLTLLFGTMTLFSFASEEEVTVLYEEESKRTEHEKHYFCSDGSYIAVSYPQAVHYLDDDGVYRDIDNSLCYDEERAAYENAGNPAFGVSLSSENGLETVKVKGKDKEEITFSTALLVNGNGKTAQPKKKNINAFNRTAKSAQGKRVKGSDTFDLPLVSSSLEYAKYYGQEAQTVTGRYTLNGNSLKEDIVLSAPAGVTGFLTTYKAGGLTLTKNEDGSLTFSDEKGTALYTVGAPYMYDADGSACPAISVTVQKKGNKYEVTYLPDASWLNSSERVYPLTFDPEFSTVQALSSAQAFDTYCRYNGLQLTYYDNHDTLWVSASQSARETAYMNFQFPSIDPAIYEITDASLKLKHQITSSSQVKLYRAVGDYTDFEEIYGGTEAPREEDFVSAGVFSGLYCTFDLMTDTSITAVSNDENAQMKQDVVLYCAGKQEAGYIIYETASSGWFAFSGVDAASASDRPQLTVTYTLRMPKGTSFTMQNEDAGTYLNMTSTGVTMTTARPAYSSALEIVEHEYQSATYYGIRVLGTSTYLSYSTTTGTVSVTSVVEGSTPVASCLWAMEFDGATYRFAAIEDDSYTTRYLASINGQLQIAGLTVNTMCKGAWIIKDHLSLDAEPGDNVEFVFYNKTLELCLDYPNEYSATAEITLAEFNPVIHETELVSGAYTATTRPRCQRFTIKSVEDSYYLILPYLKLSGDVEGFYREEYHLSVTESGEIYICTPSTGTCTAKCHWYLPSDIAGTDVTNGSKSGSIGLNLDTGTVEMVQSYDYSTGLWQIMPICLNVETDYQRTTVTCGAACGTMIVNYLKNYSSPLVTENQFLDNIGGSGNSVYIGFLKDEINRQISQANYIVGWYADLSSDNLMEKLSRSFNHDTGAFPVIMNVKPESSEEKSNWGYAYSETSKSSHFVVVNGLFYNPITNSYSTIVCDPHYKYDDVGGRTFVFDLNDLVTAFYQSPEALMHKVN